VIVVRDNVVPAPMKERRGAGPSSNTGRIV